MKNISLKVLSILLIAIIIFQFNTVLAASTSSLKNEKESNNQEITNAQSELKEVQGQKSQAMNDVENLENQITSYENQIEELEEKIGALNTNIEASEEEIQKAEEELKKTSDLLDERLVLMYEDGNTSYIDFLLSSKSLTDFLSKYYMVAELASYDTDLLEKIEQNKKQIENQKAKLESDKSELDVSKTKKENSQTQLEVAQNEKKKQVAQLSGEEKEIQQKIEQLKEDNKAIDAQIAAAQAKIQAQIQAELQKKQQQSASSGDDKQNNSSDSNESSSGGTSSASSSGFIRPVSGYSVTTGWYYSSGSLHGAVDFSGSGISGKPILAVADGIVVTTAALSSSYGNYIIIAHYNGLYTLYAHGQAGSIAVSQGQKVTQGQQIMRVGSTGNSTGPHLHFEVRTSPGKYANRVNPLNYLP